MSLVEKILKEAEEKAWKFFHGGNLDDYDDVIAQKNGRYEYGPGLYLTTHYDIAQKYAKGSRKLYILTIEPGTDISQATIPQADVMQFIKTYVVAPKRKEIIQRLERFTADGQVKAGNFNTIILNEQAVKASNTKYLRQFYIDHGIDYDSVENYGGYGDLMLVLYNMKKIKNIEQVRSKDLTVYDLRKD